MDIKHIDDNTLQELANQKNINNEKTYSDEIISHLHSCNECKSNYNMYKLIISEANKNIPFKYSENFSANVIKKIKRIDFIKEILLYSIISIFSIISLWIISLIYNIKIISSNPFSLITEFFSKTIGKIPLSSTHIIIIATSLVMILFFNYIDKKFILKRFQNHSK